MPEKKALSDRVVRFAKDYAELVEALLAQGLPEAKAREEARITATSWLYSEEALEEPFYDPADGPCPTCGRG